MSGVEDNAHDSGHGETDAVDPQRLFDQALGCRHPGRNLFLAASVHSALIPAALMIGHHFSISAFCTAASAAGVCSSRGKSSTPRSANRAPTSSAAKVSTVAAFSLSMIGLGVALGAKNANQAEG